MCKDQDTTNGTLITYSYKCNTVQVKDNVPHSSRMQFERLFFFFSLFSIWPMIRCLTSLPNKIV